MSETSELEAIALAPPPARGRRAAPNPLGAIRELTRQDMLELSTASPPTSDEAVPTAPLQSIRHRHHYVARLLAEGKKAVEVSAITGMSQSRISIIQGDPAFAELVEFYKSQVEAQYLDAHGRLAHLGIMAVDELANRLEDNPEALPTKTLMEVAEFALDRSIAPAKGAKAAGGTGAPGASSAPQINIQFVSAPPQPALEARPAPARVTYGAVSSEDGDEPL